PVCDVLIFFFQAEDGIRDRNVTGVQTCALPISKYPDKAPITISRVYTAQVLLTTNIKSTISPINTPMGSTDSARCKGTRPAKEAPITVPKAVTPIRIED